jgi:2-polyprenyl-3-methyl-5-hydroxy-6-metoxy-1,4-benzoquinol methylase
MTLMGDDVSTVPCRACGGPARLRYAEKVSAANFTDTSFSSRKIPDYAHFAYAECETCRSLSRMDHPHIDELFASYHDAEFVSAVESRFAARTYAALADRYVRPYSTVLDVGSSDGTFLAEMLRRGADVAGVEPSAKAVSNAPAVIREKTFVGPLESYRTTTKFDLVTCFQTIEHLVDLPKFLATVRGLMTTDGRILFVLHDRGSLVNKLLGEKSPVFDVEHVQILTREGVTALLTAAGFREITVRPITNRYPLSYWILLLPLPGPVKKFVSSRLGRALLALPVSIRAGNMCVVATHRAS